MGERKPVKSKLLVNKFLVFIILAMFFVTSGVYAQDSGVYILTGKEGPQIETKANDIDIIFQGKNAVHFTIPRGGFAGWDIVFEWRDPYPETVRYKEIFSIGVTARVQNAGPGSIGAAINTYLHSGGAVWHIEHNAAAAAGRSGSTGQLYSQEDVGKYKPDSDADPQFIVDVYLKDGGSTSVLLARYIYTRQGISECSVGGQIRVVWESLGGEAFFGKPTTGELDATPSPFGTNGKYQNFQKGQIIWHANGPRAGQAYALWGDILGKYNALGGTGSCLGFPLSSEADVTPSPYGTKGRYNLFEGGVIIWHTTGSYAYQEFVVEGAISNLYQNMGGTTSWLGMPVSDEYDFEGGRRSDFEGGYILWNKNEGAKAIRHELR